MSEFAKVVGADAVFTGTVNEYGEIRSDNTEERSIIPNLRWYFTPRSYLDLSYENVKVETPALTTLSDIYSGTVRITF